MTIITDRAYASAVEIQSKKHTAGAQAGEQRNSSKSSMIYPMKETAPVPVRSPNNNG